MTGFLNSSPHDNANTLLDFWDIVISGAPGSSPTAAGVSPETSSLIRRLNAAQPFDSAPQAWEGPLLEQLLARQQEIHQMPTITATAPLSPPIRPPRSARPTLGWPESARRWNLSAALSITLVVLLILASVAGIWLVNERSNDTHILAPPVATPTTEASPDVPMYRGNAGRTGVVNGPGPLGSPVELWTTTIPTSFQWSPAVVDEVLYVEGGPDGLYAIDAMTGETLWTFATASPVASAPAVADGKVFFVSDDGTLYAVDTTTHEQIWTFAGIQSHPAWVDGIVYVVSPESSYYALDAATGDVVWQASIEAEPSGAPAVANGIAYAGNQNRQYFAFDALTGESLWTFQGDGEGGYATSTVTDTIAYITASGTDTNRMYALDAFTGNVLWKTEQEADHGYISTTATADRLYSISEDGMLNAFDAANGETVWQVQLDGFARAIPILVDDTLYVVDNGGFVRSLDAATGAELWSYPIEGSVEYALTVSGDAVYTATTFGNLYAITGSGSIAAMGDHEVATPAAPLATANAVIEATPADASVPNAATALWETTGGDPALHEPQGVAIIAHDGNIWVADGKNAQFQIFAPDGSLVETWDGSGPGSGEGQFDFIVANGDGLGDIAFAADGSFYVADSGNQRIQHFNADRQFLNSWGSFGSEDGNFISPFNLALDSQGNVFVNDNQRYDVQKFDPNGNHLVTFGGGGTEQGQLIYQGFLAIAPDDTVWVADPDNGRIQHWTNDGTFIEAITEVDIAGKPVWVQTLAIDETGYIYLADIDGKRLFVLDASGEVAGVWSLTNADGSANPNSGGMAISDDGTFYLVDWGNGLLTRYELTPPLAMPVATPVT